MLDFLAGLLGLGQFAETARHRASPRPLVSLGALVGWTALIAVAAVCYIIYFDSLGAVPRLRLSLGVVLIVVGFLTVLLIGNQFDSAMTRRRRERNPNRGGQS